MVYSYSPMYYSSFQDTLASLCKSILLPFSTKNRRLPADQKLAKRQADNLKWQQESYHRIIQLIGLQKEGMALEEEVQAFRSNLLDTLIASPAVQEPACVIRDKLLFLQELLYAKCISSEDYHSSKRPLLQRLAIKGVEIDCRDVIVGSKKEEDCLIDADEEEENWTEIELRDEEESTELKGEKLKHLSLRSLWGSGKSSKPNSSEKKSKHNNNKENSSVLMPESSPSKHEKTKRKAFSTLFQREQQQQQQQDFIENCNSSSSKSEKKQWMFDGFKKWKKSNVGQEEEEWKTACFLPGDRSYDESSSMNCRLVAASIGEGPDTERIKKKIHSGGSSSDFFIDKVLGDKIKKELNRIKSELSTTNPNLNFSEEQMEQISTKLPVEKSDLKNFFPKSWCDKYGDVVVDVVKKEFKDHVGEMEAIRSAAAKERQQKEGQAQWVTFESDENAHPNLFFSSHDYSATTTTTGKNSSYYAENDFVNNPFYENQTRFWTPRV